MSSFRLSVRVRSSVYVFRPMPYDASKTHDEVRRELQKVYLDALYPTNAAGVAAKLKRVKPLSLANGLR